jgi:hypothetical protein
MSFYSRGPLVFFSSDFVQVLSSALRSEGACISKFWQLRNFANRIHNQNSSLNSIIFSTRSSSMDDTFFTAMHLGITETFLSFLG